MSKMVAKAESAGKTNKRKGSLVRCEVNLESGEWLSPASCSIYKIDEEANFPEIVYEIKTDEDGPYEWHWSIKWVVKACPQRRDKPRFSPKHPKSYSESGKFTSNSKKWKASLNEKVLGGVLTVKVKVGKTTFARQTCIKGSEPGKDKVTGEILKYSSKSPFEAELAAKIFKQETGFRHFFSDDEPLVSFDNGYGLGQATNPMPSFEQVWSWKAHVKYIVELVIKQKHELAKKYLDKHGNYTVEDLEMETLVHYNGANYHYLVWEESKKKWVKDERVLCDPDQSNTGWDLYDAENKDKTLQQLRANEGAAPKYTGRCYAEHVKNHQ
jgi:hypothetical protein